MNLKITELATSNYGENTISFSPDTLYQVEYDARLFYVIVGYSDRDRYGSDLAVIMEGLIGSFQPVYPYDTLEEACAGSRGLELWRKDNLIGEIHGKD